MEADRPALALGRLKDVSQAMRAAAAARGCECQSLTPESRDPKHQLLNRLRQLILCYYFTMILVWTTPPTPTHHHTKNINE